MRILKSIFTASLLMSAAATSYAATYNYTDLGLNYSINTDNPLITKVNFGAASFNASSATAEANLGWIETIPVSATVNAFTVAIPQSGPLGLSVSPLDGTATPLASNKTVQLQVSGTYSFGGGLYVGPTDGAWNHSVTLNLDFPRINLWDFPNEAPLLTGYKASKDFTFWPMYRGLPLFTSEEFIGPNARSYVYEIRMSYLEINQNGQVDLDIYGGVRAIPIPSSVFLFGSGLIGLMLKARRRAS